MKFQFCVRPNNSDTAWKIRASDNHQVFFEQDNVQDIVNVAYEFNDDIEIIHQIQIEISGKGPNDTVLDQQGNIVKDNVIELSNFVLDEFDIDQIVYKKSLYSHDFNGTGAKGQHQFYGIAGCNGTISFEFRSPAYIWLLEVM